MSIGTPRLGSALSTNFSWQREVRKFKTVLILSTRVILTLPFNAAVMVGSIILVRVNLSNWIPKHSFRWFCRISWNLSIWSKLISISLSVLNFFQKLLISSAVNLTSIWSKPSVFNSRGNSNRNLTESISTWLGSTFSWLPSSSSFSIY